MAILTTAQIAGEILEKDIAPMIDSQLEDETYLLKNLPKDKRNGFSNDTIYQTIRVGRNASIASLGASNTTLPTSSFSKWEQVSVNPAYVYATMQLDERTLFEAKGNPGSLVNILTEESKNLKLDMAKDLNRQLFGDGTGTIATTTASSTGTTVTVDSTKYIADGQLLTINGDAVVVNTVLSATTFTITGAATIGSGEAVKKTEGISDMNGLALAVGTGAFEGLTNFAWQSYVDSTSETYSSLTAMTGDMRAAKQSVDKYGKTNIILTSYELRNKFMQLHETEKQYVNTTTLQGGFGDVPTFDGVGIYVDVDCQADAMYFVDWNALSLEKLAELQFRNRGTAGGVLEPVTGKTYYEAAMFFYGNLLVSNRRKLAKLTGKA